MTSARTRPVDTLRAALDGTRNGWFAQTDWSAGRMRITVGARTDAAELTDRRTYDPRLAIAFAPAASLTLTAAWGRYHQVPDPALFEAAERDGAALLPMRAEHRILGVQWADGDIILRAKLTTNATHSWRSSHGSAAYTAAAAAAVEGWTCS